ncbi:Zona pellucida domain-containing protein [Aphelenchoides bicaudatus]|nr:Zona pellucida domain-containing protein [Aphelenchoides bicaudatus]
MWLFTWLLLPALFAIIQAEQQKRQIDGIVVGEPTVVCEADAIHIYIKTREAFVGNIYARSHFMDNKCRSNFQNNKESSGYLSVKLGECGMIRTEQSNPKGVSYTLGPSGLQFGKYQEDMPETTINGIVENNCDYSIRVESVSGPLVRFSRIGDNVVHRWACEDKHQGILIKDCVAESESVFRTEVIDNRGCPISEQFQKLQYNDDLTMAFVQLEVFKFPDVDTVRFSCNISFCEKINGGCIGITPPNCPIVGRNEFMPHSVTDSSIDPTRVYIPFDIDPANRSPLFQTTKRYNPFRLITSATRSPLNFRMSSRQKDYVKNEGSRVCGGFALPSNFRSLLRFASQPVAQALHSSTDSPNLLLLKKNRTSPPLFRSMSSERNVRARRDEERTLNVKSGTMVVSDAKLSGQNPQKRSIFMSNGEADGFCLNKTTSTALLMFVALLSAFSLLSSGYILYDVYSTRHKRVKAQITTRRDSLPANEYACTIKAFNSMMNK